MSPTPMYGMVCIVVWGSPRRRTVSWIQIQSNYIVTSIAHGCTLRIGTYVDFLRSDTKGKPTRPSHIIPGECIQETIYRVGGFLTWLIVKASARRKVRDLNSVCHTDEHVKIISGPMSPKVFILAAGCAATYSRQKYTVHLTRTLSW